MIIISMLTIALLVITGCTSVFILKMEEDATHLDITNIKLISILFSASTFLSFLHDLSLGMLDIAIKLKQHGIL